MMYPRLELLREFLSEDGAIFISINDNEQAYLKIICDKIFDRKNFVVNVIWEKKYSPQNDARWLSDSHDFILVYALKKDLWRPNLLPRTAEMNARYKNPDNDPRGVWKSSPLHAKSGVNTDEYIFPNGVKWTPPPGTFRRYSEETLKNLYEDNRIYFGKDGKSTPQFKRFLTDVKQGLVSKTLWFRDECGDNHEAKRELSELNVVFDTPKPTRLIERVFRLATDKDSIVLDAFAGSGTTAHAVINLNAADGGKRRFILIEREAYCETITAERVRRVGGEFRYCRVGERLFNEMGALNPAVTFEQLASYIWFKFTQTPRLAPEKSSPLIGIHEGTAYYLIRGGLTHETLSTLPAHDGKKIIFAEACRMSETALQTSGITFKQIPKDIR